MLLPVGHAKTFSMAAVALYELGTDPTCRGAVISATQGQAAKILGMVRDYIETSLELRTVFPQLQPSPRRSDPWTSTAIVVDRPAGIRDPSLQAVGLEGAINGSRLKFIVVDDVLTHENTLTRDARDKTYAFLDSSVQSRLDVSDSRIVVTNTAWHDDDVAHRFLKRGWPGLRMEIDGMIEIYNDDDWDCVELRPAAAGSALCRLAARQDADPLWPEKYSAAKIEKLKSNHLPQRFNQLYRNICYDETTARCKSEWIEICKRKARDRGYWDLVPEYRGPNLTLTGVDLAVQAGEANDETAFFTFEAQPDGSRRILDIEIGQFDGPTIVRKLFAKHAAYNSIIRVESNACFAPGSNVLTKQGYMPIECVTPGVEVWTHNARWRPVTRAIEGSAKILCTARAWGNLPVRCTPNHWFWLREAGRDPTWVSVGFVDVRGCEASAYAGLAIPKWSENADARQRRIRSDYVFDCVTDIAPSIEWFGWPLDLRLRMVRRWLLGADTESKWPSRISACSISRNWMLFARSTLFEAGYRPTLSVASPRKGNINGRNIESRAMYIMCLNTDKSDAARSRIVLEDGFAWAKLRSPQPGGPFEPYGGPVYNLEVEDDASFVVDDYVVHNAQDFVRQFALNQDISLPIKAHVTGRAKAHPEHGVEGLFVELSNGAWAIPNDKTGNVHPMVARFINSCLNYSPTRHTDDVLMAAYFAREQAKAFGVGGKVQQKSNMHQVVSSILSR
jgi:hypothetical protein